MTTGRRTRGLALLAIAAAGLTMLGTPPGAEAAAGCDIATIRWDGGAGTTAWGTATNWNLDRVPEATDHVCIDATAPGASVLFSTGTVTVKSLDARKPFTVSGGTLTLGDTTQPSTITGGLTLSGGVLGGGSARTLDGTLSWTGGALAGPATTTVPAGKTLTISGTATKGLRGPLHNAGTVVFKDPGTLGFEATSVFTNAGAFNIDGDGLIQRTSFDSRFTNLAAGTILKRNGVNTAFGPVLENDGTVRSDVGALTLASGTPTSAASAGKFIGGATAASVVFDAGTTITETGAQIVGPGSVTLAGGTVSGPLTVVSGGRLRWTDGTLTGPTTGDIVVASGGTISVEGTGGKLLNGRLTNNGTFRLDGVLGTGPAVTITNKAQMPVVGAGSMDVNSGSGQLVANTITGVIEHTGAADSVGSIEIGVDNDGIVRSAAGRLELTRGSGSAVSVGAYDSSAGATLAFSAGKTVFGAGGKLTGAGRIELLNDAELSGVWQVVGGTTLTFIDGTLSAPTDGTYARVLTGGVIDIPTNFWKYMAGTIRNDGLIRLDGFVSAADRLGLVNTKNVDLIGASEFNCCDGSVGPRQIFNMGAGVIRKIGAADSTATIEVPIDNDGIVRAETGTLRVTGGTGVGREAGGEFGALTGATLSLPSGEVVFGNAGRLAGPGTVLLEGANLKGAFRVKSGTTFRHVSGDLYGPTDTRSAFIEPGAKWLVQSTSFKGISGNVANQGTATIDGDLSWLHLGVLTNSGIIYLEGSPVLEMWGGNDPRLLVNDALGIIRKQGAPGSIATIDVPFDNDGKLQAYAGTVELWRGTGTSREAVGEYHGAKAGAVISFMAGRHNFGAGGRVSGPAPVQVGGNGVLAGQWTVKAGGQILQVDGEVTGSPSGTPALIEAGGSWVTSTASLKFFSGRIRNEGSVRFDGPVQSYGVSEIFNAAALELAGAVTVALWDGSPMLNNLVGGTIRKTGAGSSVASIDIPVENDGVVRAEGGTLNLEAGSGGRVSTGEYSAAASGPVTNLADGVHTVGPGARFTGPGRTGLTGGTLLGTFNVASGGRLVQSGGTIDGPPLGEAPTTVDLGGVLATEGTALKFVSGEVRNLGTISYGASQQFFDQVHLENEGVIDFPGGATINVWGGPGPRVIHNTATGIIVKTGLVASLSRIDIPVDNDGVIRAESGSLSLDDGTGTDRSTGVYRSLNVPTTAVRFGDGTHEVDPGATIEGPGGVYITGGAVAGPLTVKPGGSLRFTGGTLAAPVDGTGELLVDAGGELRVSGTSSKWFQGPIRNHGLMAVSGPVTMDLVAEILNDSTLELSGAGAINCSCGSVVNSAIGTVRVPSGTTTIHPSFENAGTVIVDSGELSVRAPTDFVSGALTGGTWYVKGRLQLASNPVLKNLATALTLDGSLAAVVGSSGANALAGMESNSGTLTLINRSLSASTAAGKTFTNTGAMDVGPGAAFTTRKFLQNGGLLQLDATATLTSTDPFTLAGGMVTGAGRITGPVSNVGGSPPVRLKPGAEMDIAGSYTQGINGLFDVELTGAGAGVAQRQLLGTGSASLGGRLEVSLDASFVPVVGDRYTLGSFASVSGTFASLLIESPPGFVLEPFYNGTEFGVEVRSA